MANIKTGVGVLINGKPTNLVKGLDIGTGDLPARQIKLAYQNIGKDHQRTMARDMRRRDKTGIVYKLSVRGRRLRHRASAPGETAANLSGTMSSGIDYAVSGISSFEFGVTGKAFYARFLELGTKGRNVNGKTVGIIEPRPSLQNTVKKLERNTFNYFADEIQKELFKVYNPG